MAEINNENKKDLVNVFDVESVLNKSLRETKESNGVSSSEIKNVLLQVGLGQEFQKNAASVLNEFKPNKYKVTLIAKDVLKSYNLTDANFYGAELKLDNQNNEFSISVDVDVYGYFDFQDSRDKNNLCKYSAVKNALLKLKHFFTYLSFFQKTLILERELIFNKTFNLIIENQLKKVITFKFYDEEIEQIFLHLTLDDRHTLLKNGEINQKILKILDELFNLNISLNWFIKHLFADQPEDRLISLCVAYEALYKKTKKNEGSKNTDKGNKEDIAARSSFSIASTVGEREFFFNLILELFKQRNYIVHAIAEIKSHIEVSQLIYVAGALYRKVFSKEINMRG